MHVEFAILVMPILLLAEWLWGKIKRKSYYSFSDTIVNMCCGMMDRTIDIFWGVVMFSLFVYVYDNFAIYHIPVNIATWVALFFLTDFLYYWFHRFSHEINMFWGVHETHHQSEEFNYTVAFRLSGLTSLVRTLFWIPLIILGCEPKLALSLVIIQGLYQYFTHTQMIRKMGFLEKVLVTPSSHRVHHSSNEKYIDKNYGGVFIIWDRFFGTYCPEEEKVVYGTIKPFKSYNPYWAYFHYWTEMVQKAKYIRRWPDKLKFFFARPGYVPVELLQLAAHTPDKERMKSRQRRKLPTRLKYYIVFQALTGVLLVVLLVLNSNQFSLLNQLVLTLLIGLVIFCIGKLLEQREKTEAWEYLRLMITLCGLFVLFASHPLRDFISGLAFLISLAGAIWFRHL